MASIPTLQMSWQPPQKRKGGPLGLRNLGNSCYLNSVLQCLTYTPPLANFCLLNHHSSSCNSVNGSSHSACAFCLVERRISRSLSIDAVADSPTRIHSCLSLFAKHFRDGCQEDAHEFLRYVIEACNSVCVKLQKLLSAHKFAARQGDFRGSKEEPHTVVKEIFGGVLQSQVKCLSCSVESNKMDDIMDLSLDVIQISSLKEAICRYFQPEVLDGSNKYRCEKCKKLSAARKQMSIFRAPNVLVIQLKRFENIYGGKIDRYIGFEERLELAGHMCRASQDPRPEYQLYGVIVHAGYSQESGHYYSYVKDANGKWFCCNDAHVTPVNSQSMLGEKAYILFYVRSNARSKTVKDRSGSQNGHMPNPSGTHKPAFRELQRPSSKENILVSRCNTVNSSSLIAGKVQDRLQVKFNLFKAGSNCQPRKPLSNENGRAERSTVNWQFVTEDVQSKKHLGATTDTSNGLYLHLENSTDVENGGALLQKQSQGLPQARISESVQCAVERSCFPPDDTCLNDEAHLVTQNAGQKAKMANTNTKKIQNEPSQNGSSLFLEEANGTKPHMHGHSVSSRYVKEEAISPVLVSQQQQGSYQLSGDNMRIFSDHQGCSENKRELKPKECETSDRPKLESKRQKCDGSRCLTSECMEGNIAQWQFSGRQDSANASQLETLKFRLAKDSREWLHRSDWCDTVRNSFRVVKRKRVQQESRSSDVRREELRFTPFESWLPCRGGYFRGGGQFSHRRLPLHKRHLGSYCNSGRQVVAWQPTGQVSYERPAWAAASYSNADFSPWTKAVSGLSRSVFPDQGLERRPLGYNSGYPWAQPPQQYY